MTAWCDAPGSAPVHSIEPSTKVACPKCGDALLPDSKFCRHCGHKLPLPTGFAPAAAVALPEDGTSQDGLQFLCAKYSALITRLREEVLAHQQSQAEARRLERRLRDESQIWAKEKEQLMREQQCLQDEIASLKSQLYGGRQHDLNGSRCGMAREPTAANQLRYQHEAQHKQHQQMMTLLNEHSQLQLEERTAQDELNACRDHLSRWRRKATDLESKALEAEQQRSDAEKKARCAQEEMRQALRSLSGAKNRQREAEKLAKQEGSQARDLEERLKALRFDSRQNARRANGAAGRLAHAEAMEQRAGELETEVMQLQRCLQMAQSQGEEARSGNQRLEEAEERAALHAGEVKGELRAAEAMTQSHSARVKELEVQLLSAREALAEAENQRLSQTTWTQRLGHELADARAGEQEARQREAQQSHELHEARRRLEQLVGSGGTSGGQLAQCKRRVAELEQVCDQQEAELAEERRARERCHMEAVKATEKLRLARAQGAQMKEKVKSLEEAEPIIKDGWLNELGRAVLHDAQKLAKIFIQSMSYRKTDGSKSDVQKLRIRLACVDHVQCPRVHWDDVPLRLVCTLAGAGTEVLPEGRADRGTFQDLLSMPLERQVALNSKEWNQRVSRGVSHRVGQGQAGLGDLTPVPDGWAVLLKGSAWHGEPGASPGALHCSPREASKRVLLQVDLAEYL